jgi:hypothetical protein
MSESRVLDLDLEKRAIRRMGLSFESTRMRLQLLDDLFQRAKSVPGGYVKKITWDEASGHPEHAWGYLQYTVRPFVQGFGCDGTTDSCIHLLASVLCDRLGIDYYAAYLKAYPDDSDPASTVAWLRNLKSDHQALSDTLIPTEITDDVLVLLLSDLYQINNRSLVAVLEDELEAKSFNVRDFCFREKEAKERSFAQAALLAAAA